MDADRGLTYREAGVDVEAGDEAVRRIKGLAASTNVPGVLGGIGGFGGLFHLASGRWRDPVLVAGADGVGTKLKIAFALDRHDTVGIDAVAYCVNDVIVQGAEPLFFLDYIGLGKLEPGLVETIVRGVAEGCRRAGCALLGGETAELPGLYRPGEYDLVGFCVGAVEREAVIDGRSVRPGDAIVGIGSTGLQSSGFSLVREVLLKRAGLPLEKHFPELGRTLGEELLEPTGIYARQLLAVAREFELRAAANISGGGLLGNIPRVLPAGTCARIRRGSWPTQPIFDLIRRRGRIEEREMFRTFNLGIAMVLVVPADAADAVCRRLHDLGERAHLIGEIVAGEGDPEVVLV
ncbi:MAG TPA: phosphoribosylformylglycinamidine cyclo-ligase [Clostridiales bacterium]|nr:phosphoribosylformylglycinamidine cyclo-ligase [Clostridiales bacterium]